MNDEERRANGPDGPARPPAGPPGPSPVRPPAGEPGRRSLPRGWQAVPPSRAGGPDGRGGVPSRRPDGRFGADPRTARRPDGWSNGPRPPGAGPAGSLAASPTRASVGARTGYGPGGGSGVVTDVVSGTAFAGHPASSTTAAPLVEPSRPGGAGGDDGDDGGRGRGRGRRGRGSDERPPSRWRRARRITYVVLAVILLGPLLAFAIGWIFFRVPTADDAANNQIATISYANGAPLASLVPEDGNRIKVPITQVPLPVQQAVLSAEDRSFYTNYGFDPGGILRAVWKQATGGVGGGSTITQQYVKNVLVGDQYSLWRKYREVVIAAKVNQEQSKDQILENYLNTIYFGRGAYGIQAASQAYFSKDVSALTPSEGAMLAGLIQAPSKWDPAVDLPMSQQRWTFVLDGMVTQNWLSPADRAAATFPAWVPPKPRTSGIPDNDRGHVVSAVRDELGTYGITEQQVNQEGLQITTTVDPRLQQQAADAATNTLDGQPKNLRTSLVSVDPRTGAVLAYYGGQNGSGFDYAQTKRQPGSSFKPFVLLAGLERTPPIGLGTRFNGSTPQTIAGTKVENSDGESCPNCDLKTAMTQSINTVFYQLGVQVGPQRVADAAHQAGVTAPLPDPSGGISIGDKEVTPGDMASAYATFAADGVYHRPHLVTRVTTADGRVLYDSGASPGEPRMSQQLARNVTESMLDVASHSGIPLSGGRPVASKTGTVQSQTKGQNNDAWMVGYTPSLATAVWVGTDDNSPIKTSGGSPIYGRGVPGEVWQSFMNSALRGRPTEQFSPFQALGTPVVAPTPTDPNQICINGVCYPINRDGAPSSTGAPPASGADNPPTNRPQTRTRAPASRSQAATPNNNNDPPNAGN